jgi:hypothetical protein
MGVPLKQQISLGLYILGKKLRRDKRYPLVLMPRFQYPYRYRPRFGRLERAPCGRWSLQAAPTVEP